MATFIPADSAQPVREVAPGNERDFQLQELYELLHCQTIEVLALSDGRFLVCDEEGKFVDQPERNDRATALADFASPAQIQEYLRAMEARGFTVFRLGDEADYIAGDVLVCQRNELR